MLKNITFALIAVFWVVMTALLVHSQFGSGSELVSSVPVRTVFEKILTAPDDSTLGIMADGVKIGYVRWRPLVQDAAATDQVASESEPEGMVERISQYTLDLDGSFLLKQFERTIKIGANVSFNRQLQWQNFTIEGVVRPVILEIKGSSESRDLWLKTTADEQEWIRRVTFDELKDPGPLLQELNLPILQALLNPQLPGQAPPPLELNIQWQAHYDWLQIGSSRLRIYRLEGQLSDGLKMVVLVSRVGELLRVELPGRLKLFNDALFSI